MTIFDTVPLVELRERTSIKWSQYPPDVLPCWVAEMDVPQPAPVVRAVTEAMRLGDTGYDAEGLNGEALAPFVQELYGWEIDAATTRSVPDVMIGAAEVLSLVTERGAPVVINPPVYPPFAQFIEHAGRRVVRAPLGDDGRLDLDVLDSAFARASGGAYLLCHPHNPTGAVHTSDELGAVGDLARRHRVRVVADEIHAPLVLRGAFTPTTTVIPDAIALHSASKAFNLAGLKSAVAVPGPDAVDDLARLPEIIRHGVSHLGTIAHAAAYAEGRSWLAEVLDGLRANQALVEDLLAAQVPKARWEPPAATYFAWIDLRAYGAEPSRRLLQHGRLAVNDGATFGAAAEGYVRLNLAASTATLTEAVRRMRLALG
ncbi:MalY/PatB family protein [Cellulomonas sp. PhB150]|uniref:MalY/PatB family protein n=1 Tax=Cellulomonas sp. PhB150 TaxID=2485188 RepID=UPI000FBBDFD5|nr:aminotransferase class I/II-fold pyridoxal phosphate-dependent enzyme [Cellulomonas sp. PhB150]ROS26152.1 cystathionine beta-lyase [Cellulomonas sp. PhB150]